jgi:hypothetical protein
VLGERRLIDLALLVLIVGAAFLVAPQEHHEVGVLLDGAGLAQSDSRGSFDSRISGWRESCESAMTGIDSSRASALSPREISDTSWTGSRRDSSSSPA